MTVKELTDKESDAFLAWRRNLAKVEEENYTIHLTPYEKNVEVWK
jgi:large subunit GTPase 1